MRLRPILRPSREGLRLLLAGLLAGSALLAPSPRLDPRLPTLDPPSVRADGPNDWPFHWKGWPMFRHDPAHTGYNPDETQLKPPLRLKWSYTTDGWGNSSPAVAGGLVAVPGSSKLDALDAGTGALKWSYPMGAPAIWAAPAIGEGKVYLASLFSLHAVDASTGVLVWTYRMPQVENSATIAGNTVYIGSGTDDFGLYALDASTGSLKWRYQLEEGYQSPSSPAIAGGIVYVGIPKGVVYAVDAATGAEKWKFRTTSNEQCVESYLASSPSVSGGVAYVGVKDRRVYALDGTTGAIKWSYETGGVVCSSPAVAEGVVYIGSSDGRVYAFDAVTGSLKWSYSTGGSVTSSPAVANGVVYVGSIDGRLYGLDAATGVPKWQYAVSPPSASIRSSPAVASGTLYIIIGRTLFAFETAPPPVTMQPLAVYQTGSASFPVSWSTPAIWTGPAVTGYDVQRGEGATAAWTSALTNTLTSTTWIDWLTNTTAISATFSGQDGHTYSFRARATTVTGAAGDWSEAVSTTVDLTAPTGSLAVQGWGSNVQPMNATLAVSAADATSGVGHMQFSSDGQTYSGWETYATSRSYTLPAGANTVYARFQDNAGNVSQPVSATVPLDATPPSGSMSVEGWGSNYVTTSVTLRLSAADTQSGLSHTQLGTDAVAYSDWETYATSRAYTLPAGATRVYARFKDRAGNVSQPVSATVTVDATPPTGWLTLNEGATYTNNRRVTVGLLAGDDLSGVSHMAFSSDGATYGDWQAYASLTTLSLPPGDGEKTLYARFMDRAGNVSNPASDSITLDTTPPTTPAPDDGLTGAISSPTVTLQWPVASDALSGVEKYYYKADCGSETATSGLSATTPTLPDGEHTFYVRARDQAGNYSPYGKHAFTIRATSLDSPDLYAPDSPTDRDKINVSGLGPAKTPIRLYLNCAYYGENQSGNYGAWQFQDVPLALGENVIVASIVDSGGGLSPISLPAVVVRLKTLTGSPIKSAVSLLTPSGGSVSAGRHTVEVPGGALPGEAQVVVTPYGTEGAPPLAGKRSIGAFASITARERGTGAPAQLQKAVRITLGYDPQALGGVSPDQLSVHYYDPDTFTWVALTSQVDTANRRVTAEANHLSDFALLADLPPMPVKVYLPLVPRAAGGW